MSGTGHQNYPANAKSGRQMAVTGQYNSPHYAQGDLRQFCDSSVNQQQYHPNVYANTQLSPVYDGHIPNRSSGWQSIMPDQTFVRSPSNYGHADSHPYSVNGQRLQTQDDYSLYSQTHNETYGTPRATYSSSATTSSEHYRLPPGSLATLLPLGYHFASLPFTQSSAHAHPTQSGSRTSDACEWGPGRCLVPLEDSTPAGIARHLRQHHDVPATDNRNRSMCVWGGRCGKDMFPSSFGKHIAECHLRNMTKQCPQCGADFARADTLSRHIKAFCPNTVSPAGHSRSLAHSLSSSSG